MTRRAAPVLAGVILPTDAAAHAFDAGADAYRQIIEGAFVPLADPVLLLALLPLGLALGIWRTDGLSRLWPALAVGLVAGAAAAPFAGVSVAPAAILAGLALALMGAAALRWPVWLMATAATATGLVSGMAAFEGHAFGEIPAPVALGTLAGALLVAVVAAGLVSFTRDATAAPWVTLAWRIAASWLAAIALMLAALRLA